jgi:hypothetical protein
MGVFVQQVLVCCVCVPKRIVVPDRKDVERGVVYMTCMYPSPHMTRTERGVVPGRKEIYTDKDANMHVI